MIHAIPRYGVRHVTGSTQAALDALARGEGVQGGAIAEFEKRFAEFHEVRHAISASYGRMAFYYILRAFNFPRGSEVIFPALTFWVVPEMARICGLRPVFVDIDPAAFTIDPIKFESAITPRTVAVVPTHLYGLPCEMDAVMAIARRHGLKVIEDCAHSLGATFNGIKTGRFGDAALFSFHLGDRMSWLWALDREGLALYVLPPRKQVEEQANISARAIRDDTQGAAMVSAKLYRTLFGRVAPRFQKKSRWLIALDRGMFDAPVAALTEDGGARPTFVAEHHVIQFIPGLGYWLEARARRAALHRMEIDQPLFVGIGDPIYNTADPRLGKRSGFGRPVSGGLLLPRLVASGAELEACARVWNGVRVAQRPRRDAQPARRTTPAQPGRAALRDARGRIAGTSGFWIDRVEPDRPERDGTAAAGRDRALEDAGGSGGAERMPLGCGRGAARHRSGGPHASVAAGRCAVGHQQ